MNAVQTVQDELQGDPNHLHVTFPLGLLGFEGVTDYELIGETDQAPFRWLQALNDSSISFVVVSPFDATSDYAPVISRSDCEFLGIDTLEDALIFGIVTLQGSNRATVNLKAPIVLNPRIFTAKQVILTNAANFSLRHTLPVAAA